MAQSKKPKRTVQSDIEPHESKLLRPLTRLSIHPRWDQQLFGPSGQAWMSVRSEGSTIFGECFDCKAVTSQPDSSAPPFPAQINGRSSTYSCLAGFRILNVSSNTIEVTYDQTPGMTSRAMFQAPRRIFGEIFKRSANSVDVQPEGQYGAAVNSTERLLKVWRMDNQEVVLTLKDQGDINLVKWIPGTKIFAYAEASSIRLYSTDKNKNLRSLKGHANVITEMTFGDRGKSLFSSSYDGKVLLWDVSRTDPIQTVAIHLGEIISCISVQTAHTSISEAYTSHADGTSSDGRVLLYGRDSPGILRIVSVLASPGSNKLFEYSAEQGITCCTFLDHPYFACGTDSGVIYYFDWRRPDRPLHQWREIRGGIFTMMGWKTGVICGTADGSCFMRNPVMYPDNATTVEFCGCDEQVLKVCCYFSNLVTCCRDGKIRQYDLP